MRIPTQARMQRNLNRVTFTFQEIRPGQGFWVYGIPGHFNSGIWHFLVKKQAYTHANIPQREGITTVCHAYKEFHQGNPPVPTRFLSEMLSLILLENSFQFNLKDYLQTHGTAMGTKMAVAFANIFMAKIEKEILRQSSIKPIFWKRFIDDVIQYGTQAETK